MMSPAGPLVGLRQAKGFGMGIAVYVCFRGIRCVAGRLISNHGTGLGDVDQRVPTLIVIKDGMFSLLYSAD